jgi:uncharacterized membrane protein YsdA (DUF1294 family)
MEQAVVNIISGYLLLMSLIGIIIMGIDKRRSIRKAWRVPEKTLLLVAFLGGGIGSFLGMYAFRHKTKHIKFVISLPLTAALYIFILLKLYHII